MSERVAAVKAEMKRLGLERVMQGMGSGGDPVVSGWFGDEGYVSCRVGAHGMFWKVDVNSGLGPAPADGAGESLQAAVGELRKYADTHRKLAEMMERVAAHFGG